MVRCDACGSDVLEAEDSRCPHGHPLPDQMLVLPDGAVATAGDGSVVSDEPGFARGPIRLRPDDPTPLATASSFLDEALSALADAQAPVAPAPAEPRPEQAAEEPEEPEHLLGEMTREDPEDPQAEQQPVPAVPAPMAMDLFGKPQSARSSRRRMLAVPLIAALVLGSGSFVVLRPGRADAATYRLSFAAGESHRYAFRMNMSGAVRAGGIEQPMDAVLSMDLVERVTAVSPDGIATVRQQVDRASFTVGGQKVGLPRTTVTMRLAPDGRVLQVQGLGGSGCAGADPSTELFGPGQMYPAFSPDAVAPGDEWTLTQRYPNPLTGGTMPVTTRNRLVSLSDGVALIRSDITMPVDMKVRLTDLARAVQRACGEVPGEIGLLPPGARLDYGGDMRMQLTQSVDRATGRPVTVTGTGTAAVTMRMEGLSGIEPPEVSMDFSVEVSFTEQTGRAPRHVARGDTVVSA